MTINPHVIFAPPYFYHPPSIIILKCIYFFYSVNKTSSSTVLSGAEIFLRYLIHYDFVLLYIISSVQCPDFIERNTYIILEYKLYMFDVEMILFLFFTVFERSSKSVCSVYVQAPVLKHQRTVQTPDVNRAIAMFIINRE